MEWKVEYLAESGTVHMQASGRITLERIQSQVAAAVEHILPGSVGKFLFDYREASLDLTITELCELPDRLEKLGITKYDRLAIVYPPPSAMDFVFYETVARARRCDHRVFSEPDGALIWLARA